jgi:hypothetical protein
MSFPRVLRERLRNRPEVSLDDFVHMPALASVNEQADGGGQ